MPHTQISSIKHPEYLAMLADWDKFRLTFDGGRKFINFYLEQFTARENPTDYASRKKITYCPAFAKAALKEIINSIFIRLSDVSRIDGPKSYQQSITDHEVGVDLRGNTMTSFMGRYVLPELLSMAKVGVYIDKPQREIDETLANSVSATNRPYIYVYKAEQILSWTYNARNQLTNLLLVDINYVVDDIFGLPTEEQKTYRYLTLTDVGVEVIVYAEPVNKEPAVELSRQILDLKQIPFVLFEINESLLTDVADYQISLLNVASSDIVYCTRANFPFYVEQWSPALSNYMRQARDKTERESNETLDPEGTSTQAQTAGDPIVEVGGKGGRRYPKGMDAPSFIHPSSEPLQASMDKQEALKDDIRQLVGLNLVSVQSKRESADSKKEDVKSKEEGLATIGLELEYGEGQIAKHWAEYEAVEAATVKYPEDYSLKTDTERQEEAESLSEIGTKLPSKTFQRVIAKRIATVMVGTRISPTELDAINSEIDKSEIVFIDPDIIRSDHESGFVGTELSSSLRGYPEGEVDKAKADHAERAARIALAQSKATAADKAAPAARGVVDQDPSTDGTPSKLEKLISQSADDAEDGRKKVRRKGKSKRNRG